MNLFDEALQKQDELSIKIKKVSVQNYRNIEYKEYVLNGNSLLLEGKNGIGKTNVLEAIYWALSGLLFNGVSLSDKQEVKPDGSANDIVTSVKLEFIHNSFTFERRIEEKWSKDGETKKGTETTLLVNGAPSKDQDTATNALYDYLGISNMQSRFAKNTALAKSNISEIVYSAQTWRDVDYKVTKAILTDMVGEADFKEIVNENPEKYMPLVTPLKEHGMDLQALKTDTRSKVLDKNSGLEKQVSDLKANIKAFDESGKKIANAEELKTAKEQIESIDTEISELEKQKTTSASELIRQYDGEISGKQNKIYERENVLRTAHEEEIKKIKDTSLEKNLKSKQDSCMGFQKERIELSEKIGNKEREKSKTESSLESKKGKLEEQEKKLGKLRTEWKELKHPDIKYTCPNCQKSFTIGEVKEYQESLKPKLEQVDKDGKETTQNIKGFQEGIESLELEVAVLDKTILGLQNSRIQLDTNIKNLEGEIETLQEKIKKQTSTLPILNFETDETILSLKKEIEEIKGKKQTALTDYTQHISDLSTKIDGLKLKKQPFTDVLNLESTARSYQQSAEESRKKLEIVNRNLQTQKDIEVLVKELEKEMYERLDEKVQGVFGSNFRFKLWKLNVTDGTYDTRLCEIYVRDIKDRFINIRNINTGMFPIRANELIGKIKAHYGIPKSFILVDELGTLDMEHREIVKSFGEQIFATQKGESADIIETLF